MFYGSREYSWQALPKVSYEYIKPVSNSILSIKIVAQVLRSNILLTYSAEETEPELFVHKGIFFYGASEKQSNTNSKKNFPLDPYKKYQNPL